MNNKIKATDVIFISDNGINIDKEFVRSGILSLGAIGLLSSMVYFKTTDLTILKNTCSDSMDELEECKKEIIAHIDVDFI